jgi:hypothetical protein
MFIKITKAFASYKVSDVVEVADKFGKLVIGKGWAEESRKPKKTPEAKIEYKKIKESEL